MKYLLTLAAIALISFQPVKKKKVIFFGDSITRQGADAGGYIPKVDSLCKLDKQGDAFEFVGKGIGGNRVYDLFYRFQEDVLDQKPDVVVVYIGINDVWHKTTSGTGTELSKFGAFYDKMITKMKAQGIQVVMCTPSVIGEFNDGTNLQDGDLNFYSKWIREYAGKNNIPVVDLRKSFMDYLKINNPRNQDKGILTTDKVHLNGAGNLLVAQEMWNTLKKIK
ncbi:SGNH/GDSL hydrolase family protein [Niabella hibiscisoli]|uniref:SGNH/GDSL hydrolase family protein n=1 Tax=Niabella hibiscisoli TaxID=1825928 RepID=UPI001F0E251B|nr:GDSL-type esterase/lipase family protein [Niabella hibiscisoli]MCH5715079.1 GDSL-type esterase/lipase family protein [Niabella hibiscisoli]